MGCKGPETHANCSVLSYGEIPDAWPIGVGHPCFGCTEQKLAFRVALHDTATVEHLTPPDTYPPIKAEHRTISPATAGVAGLVGGALVGAGLMAAKKIGEGGTGGGS